MATRIQLFGHSFVKHLRQHIRDDPMLKYNLNLEQPVLVQYSGYGGASIESLKENLTDVTDFDPHVLVLIIGTNDLYDTTKTTQAVASRIIDLVDTILFVCKVSTVVVCPILHRTEPTKRTRYPVDVDLFNQRADETNFTLSRLCSELTHNRAVFWRFKGFWSEESKATYLSSDGVHLSPRGQHRFFQNIRAAVVAQLNSRARDADK